MDKRIIKYFDGEMSPGEERDFEQQTNSSPGLKTEVESYRKFLENISATTNPVTDDNYFSNMIPQFRAKLESKKQKQYHPRLAFATAVLTVIIIMFYVMPDKKISYNENVVNDLSTSEITDYLTANNEQVLVTNLPADVESNYDSLLDGMIYSELNSNKQSFTAASFYDKLDYSTIVSSLDQNEAAIVYEKLKSEKFY